MNATNNAPTLTPCTCVICRKPYIAAKATAERRGFCTRACEKVLEKKHGLHKKDATLAARSPKWRAFYDELSGLLRSTPGADLPPASAAQAKALLVRLLEEAGEEPFFHSELDEQESSVRTASLAEILECAFNPVDEDARSAVLAEPFRVAIEQANRGDEATLRRAIAAIQRAARDATDAWFPAERAN